MEDFRPYIYYERLREREIRLLRVSPGNFGSSLIGSLFRVRLDSPTLPPYNALSYCWGDSRRCHSISIGARRFRITRSVFEALQHIRHESKRLVIWIDQVCINQDDVLEKNVQVQQMHHVYREAVHTHIWLGPAAPGYEDALKVLCRFANEKHGDSAWYFDNYEAIEYILSQPWFRRLWVVQEVTLSKRCTVIYGQDTCDLRVLDGLYASSINLKATKSWPEGAFSRLTYPGGVRNLTSDNDAIHSLKTALSQRKLYSALALMDMFRARKCTDPRDHIYGLRGLFEAMGVMRNQQSAVDYNGDVAEVFTQATMEALLDPYGTSQYHLWSYTSIHNESADRFAPLDVDDWRMSLPSWVPDGTVVGYAERFAAFLYSAGGRCSVGLERTKFSSRGSILALDCILVGNIHRVTTLLTREDPAWSKALVSFLEHFVLATEPCQCPTSDRLCVFARALVADRRSTASSRFERWPLGDSRLQEQQLWDLLHDREYLESISTSTNRSFLTSDNGHFALGPRFCKPGDAIAVFPQFPMPFILRQRPNGQMWQMLGPAYVHGIMDGEIMEAEERGEYLRQRIEID